MVERGVADRAEQQAGEPAPPSGADHDQVGALADADVVAGLENDFRRDVPGVDLGAIGAADVAQPALSRVVWKSCSTPSLMIVNSLGRTPSSSHCTVAAPPRSLLPFA